MSQDWFCGHCRAANAAGANFCGHCGARASNASQLPRAPHVPRRHIKAHWWIIAVLAGTVMFPLLAVATLSTIIMPLANGTLTRNRKTARIVWFHNSGGVAVGNFLNTSTEALENVEITTGDIVTDWRRGFVVGREKTTRAAAWAKNRSPMPFDLASPLTRVSINAGESRQFALLGASRSIPLNLTVTDGDGNRIEVEQVVSE